LGPQIVAMLFLAGFVAYAAVWQEPASSPPGGNVPSPINVGPAAQTKQGDLTVGGALKVEGNLLDNLGRIIYNAATGKIDRARLPYEQGDITSDVDTNTYDGGYFNVSSLIPGNIIKGIAFGRNATGTAEPLLNGDLGAIGILSWGYSGGGLPGSGTPCYSSPSYCRTPWYGWYGSAWPNGFIYNSYNPRGLMSYQVASVKTCYSTFPPCPLITLPQSYTINCSSGWIKTSSWVPLFVGSACTNGYGCEGARCTWGTPPPPVYTCPPYCGSDE
jgi:hypothetical protein